MSHRILLFAALLLAAGAAHAQSASPAAGDAGAAPAASAPEPVKTPKPKPKHSPKADDANADAPAAPDAKADKSAKKDDHETGLASIIGKTLKLNGSTGALEIAKGDDKDKPLKIMTLKLSGEVISDSKQKCEISIVASGPIAASSDGSPDGLPRFSAEVPACPIVFDVIDGGVIVPPQTRACVFQAADCQASPSGVWGPEAASLNDQAKRLTVDRSKAESSIADSLKALARRSKGEEDELQKEQSDFNTLRDETCHSYEGEAAHGYCDARMTQARAALLRKQVAKAPPAKEKDSEKPKKKKVKKDTTATE